MRAGALKDRVIFYAKVSSRDEYNASIDSWPTPTIITRGEVRYLSGTYGLSNEEKFYSKSIELTVRYRNDIEDTMRVQLNGTTDLYQITYKEIIGNNEGLRFTLEKLADGLPATTIDPPTDLVATLDTETNIILTWVNNDDGDAVYIERSEDGITYTTIHHTDVNTTTYTDTYLDELTRYWYRIRHIHYSQYSAYAAIDDAVTDEYILPDVPTGLVTELLTGTSVKIDWDDMGADAYQLVVSTDGINYVQVGDNLITNTYTYTVEPAITYYFKVRSVRTEPLLYSSYSLVVSYINWSSYWATRKPSDLIVTGMRDTEIDFSWTDNSAGEASFKVYKSTDGVIYAADGTTVAGDTIYTATGLTAGTLYYFYVVGVKSGNESDPTNIYDTRFKITVDTTKAGSAADTFVLPNFTSGTYDYYVDWGEGGAEEHITTAGNHSHTYAAAGTYQIMIRGTMPQIYFISGGDKYKITSIDNWGNIKWSSMYNAFNGCVNMQGNYTDVPNFSSMNDMNRMFASCYSFNKSVEGFDTSNVTDFSFMLIYNTKFKQSLAGFTLAPTLTSMLNMLTGCDINAAGTTTNYDATLISWAAQNPPNSLSFDGGNSKYGEGLVDSGTTDGVAANKLIQSGQNFLTTVTVGDVVYNTTDGTYALVTAIDSDTQLSISADIMASGEVYRIQHSDAAKARAKLILTDLWTITDGGYA